MGDMADANINNGMMDDAGLDPSMTDPSSEILPESYQQLTAEVLALRAENERLKAVAEMEKGIKKLHLVMIAELRRQADALAWACKLIAESDKADNGSYAVMVGQLQDAARAALKAYSESKGGE